MSLAIETEDILFARHGSLALITLNRPKALNSLTLAMMQALDPRLDAWEADPTVAAVAIKGAGERAFCAGGDIRALYDSRASGNRAYRAEFYREEYSQNRRIFRYKKPYVALVDGIAMGGGVGLSVHGSHRVASERTLFAMPETGIGLFPDVGASYFLPRLPGALGMYLGLTGARLKANDCRYTGIATHYVPSAQQPALLAALAAADLAEGRAAVDAVLERFVENAGPAPLAAERAAIDRSFAADSVEGILAALEREASPWAEATRAVLEAKSPTSLKLTFRQLRAGKALDFEAAMVMEYRICQYCMDGHDFFEGVRAAIIDKDGAPQWRPATLAEVREAELDRAFAPRPDDLVFA
ncbi:MAG TPA: enoyl-CoA hydratase/isomerase family protein [Alphaproteobacteria bacterium]|nr:enoyl-CoA hydratase/isomerase family protein [Alphaproteobacteria bacterium]